MKRSFSLIEVLVGMTLFSLLASLLFGIYAVFAKSSQLQKRQEVALEKLIFLRTMLTKSLGKAVVQPKPYYLYSQEGALYFTFDNGVDPEPAFSSIIKGVLYVNDKEELVLEMAPLEGPKKRIYILQDDVREVTFEQIPEKGAPLAVQLRVDQKPYTTFLDNSLMRVPLK